jgi:hypothetical protein
MLSTMNCLQLMMTMYTALVVLVGEINAEKLSLS